MMKYTPALTILATTAKLVLTTLSFHDCPRFSFSRFILDCVSFPFDESKLTLEIGPFSHNLNHALIIKLGIRYLYGRW